jgi:Zn finger protein HypA/HybF involved in hydrogenase expression
MKLCKYGIHRKEKTIWCEDFPEKEAVLCIRCKDCGKVTKEIKKSRKLEELYDYPH